jgi:hypothetical protein
MEEESFIHSRFDVPEYMRNSKPKVVVAEIPGYHRFRDKVFKNYSLIIMYFDDGIIRYVHWKTILAILSTFSPLQQMDINDLDVNHIEDVYRNNGRLRGDIESCSFPEEAGLSELIFHLLDLYQRYNEPENIYVNGLLDSESYGKN